MKRFIPFFITIFTALTACTKYHDFERRLAVADTLMDEQPDSAYRMLCAMNEEAERLPKAQRMRHLLLRSNAQNKAYVDFTSDSIGCLLVDYYNAHGTPNERMLAHYMKGCAYRDMGDQPASLRCYNDAVAAADTSRADCNYDQLSIIYGQIARIFRHRAMPDNALQAYEYAERFAWKAKDTVNVLTIWGNKSNALINQGKIKDALRIKEAAAGEFRRMGYPQYAAQVMGLCIKWYARQRDFSKAKAAMDNYETHSGYFLENGDIEPGREDYYHIKGTYYLEKGQLDSAKHYFHKLQTEGKSTNDRYLASWGLSQLYKKTGQSDSVAKYAFLNSVQNDSIYNERTAQNLQNAQALYNYARHQENAHRKELEAKDARYRLLLLGSTCILAITLLALLTLWLRKQNQKKKKELIAAHKENKQLNTQIRDKAEAIISLSNQLKKKDADIETLVLLKESTKLLSQKCQELETEIKRRDSVKTKGEVENEPAVRRFMQMAENRDKTPDINDWAELFKVAECHYPSFTLHIKSCHNIGKNEYQVCVLTKMGFRVNDIIYLTKTSPSNLTNLRSRMMTKVFGEEGGAKDFDARIMTL